MNVGELKKILETVPDEFPIVQGGTWREFTKARPDSYLRATKPNVLVMLTAGEWDPFEKDSQ